ncbi:MAG: adenosylcobinamide-GDP ribazoletransferase, partial [Spirochaetales bacterium]|nr:adenosylcobinamide-GDP ribazoletransferase [Spirochaetales bacterium]
MRKIYDSFLTSFGLICRIPIPVKYRIDFSLFPLFFPLIGLIVSGMGFGLFFLLNPLFSLSGITAFIIILSQYLVFNLFHFDGLLDCADAFLFNTSKEKRLSILTDKRTGSFAIFAGAIYIMFKFYLLEESINILNNNGTLWLWTTVLFFYPLSGRIAGALMPAIIPPADEPGLAELLKGYSKLLVSSGIILSFAVPLFLIFLLTTNPHS